MPTSIRITTIVTVVASGVVAGIWFAFSTFVMQALNKAGPADGIVTMQAINKTVLRALPMIAMFGTAALCLWLGIWAVRSWGDSSAIYLLGGAVLYIVGTVLVTGAGNEPLNHKMDKFHAHAADAAHNWNDFYTKWMAWNHVRLVTTVAATALFAVALVRAR
jgi:uncharacterized membrane protein